jgi:SAM-dependent methyltransferase
MDKQLYQDHFDLENKHWWFISKRKIIKSFLSQQIKDKKNLKILDAGCGPGLMINELSTFGELSAMDISIDAIEFCKTKNKCDLRYGHLPDNVPFENNQFDAIICLDVIEHIEQDKLAVKKLYDLLVPGGVLIVTVPALMLLWSQWDVLNEHKRRYNLNNFKSVLSLNNFEIKKISYYNSLLFIPVLIVRMLNNLLKRKGGSDTNMPNSFLNFVLTKIFSSEEKILKYINFPIGVSLIAVARKRE